MDVDRRQYPPWAGMVAGLQSGIMGVLVYLAWMGISAAWQRRSFWTAANLMASTFYGSAAIRPEFSWPTVTGLALYITVYGLLGASFGCLVRNRLAPRRALLVGIAVAVVWYYLSFRLLWKSVNPTIPLLYAERPTLFGHLIYGAMLGRAPRYYQALRIGEPPREAAASVVE